ncbi:DNA polymerase IV [Agarivorans albus]|uniref:DNA polymerase IV n=1 Tax=Agarivorans albus MKT 106 TaxID=1331007 RepID=R9PM55_AGAAL|nr:DNA polymerase IV [Agarivorans albus]GAD02467.1 DNA polymerase IV [Agarivorans albus MKT 106]
MADLQPIQRKIIHVDMDCFYAAVEMRDQPELANVPLAVGGMRSGRGVLTTCNYLAREYGVRSAMPTHKALQLCPHLVLVPPRMQVYQEVSKQVQGIFHEYADAIEPLSLDEAYLDVSNSEACKGSATLIAEQIRQDIFAKTGLTASAGVAPVKFLAKIASDLNKPNGVYVIKPQQVSEFIETLALEKISGVGKVSIEKLHHQGLYTGGDVRRADKDKLKQLFGKFGEMLWLRCQGVDERAVSNDRKRKSVAVERTFAKDEGNQAILVERLLALLPELKRRSEKHLKQAKMNKLGVKVKFADFQQTTKEQQCQHIDESALLELFEEALARGKGKAVRLIGLHIGLAYEQQNQSPQLVLPFDSLTT